VKQANGTYKGTFKRTMYAQLTVLCSNAKTGRLGPLPATYPINRGIQQLFFGLTVSSWGAQVKPLLCRVSLKPALFPSAQICKMGFSG
jgi:hypothetical protein